MGYKLGRERGVQINNGEIKSKMRFTKDHVSIPGTPIIRKPLGEDILGEANMDGSIFISDKIIPGSREETEVLMHEMRHATDMKIGKLRYGDYEIVYNGQRYKREQIDGKDMIHFEGEWIQAGDNKLPWEMEADNGNN
tara:strand:- start:1481 stop:1894 length:414 start_codon:yes stop_codon:yes gene_type:complete